MSKKFSSLLCIGLGAILLTAAAGLAQSYDVRIAAGIDDVEEYTAAHNMYVDSSDIEMPYEDTPGAAGDEQIIGLRWVVPIPKGANIGKAYVEFTCDETKSGTLPVNLVIDGDLTPNAPAFTTATANVSSRPRTKAQVQWAAAPWTASGQKIQTADLSAVIQEIVNQPGWGPGNALVLIFSDDKSNPSTGIRGAVAYEGSSTGAALLHLEIARGPASSPKPADGTVDVPREVSLSWNPGQYAASHDVYFGTVQADVTAASRGNPQNVLASRGQTGTSYTPAAALDYGQTYYWRVDEVNSTPANTVYPSSVWSFTVEPYSYPLQPVAATASSSQAGMGPENTINGSGLTGDLHGAEPTTMWLSAGVPPNWIQYEFDKVYKLDALQVWNSNQLIESFLGFGAKTVTIETSTDGATWRPVADVPEFSQAPGAPGYAANTVVSLDGIEAKYIKLTITANWGGLAPQTGLAEVRFTYVPVRARDPEPATAGTGVSIEASLSWRPGREATSHKVYFGTDADAVAAGTVSGQTVIQPSYTPAPMDLDTTYYWKVDEIGATTYAGDVWSFTTEDSKVVEDFESYTDQPGEEVFLTWIDGYDNPASNGAVVGLASSINGTFCDTTIFHGGRQSMPFAYDNTTAPLSEATRTFATPQDWTARGVKSLSLWFRGSTGSSGQLYVKVNSTKLAYDGDATNLARTGWQVWNIDLAQAGNVKAVRSLTIGIEGAGAQGALNIDDIRLYPKTPEYVNPVQPAATDLVGWWKMDDGAGNTAKDSSGKGNDGTTAGSTSWVAGTIGGALQLGGSGYVVVDRVRDDLPGTDLTLSAWIKTTQSGEGNVFAFNDAASAHPLMFGVSGTQAFTNDGGDHSFGAAINNNEWHLITFVRSGSTGTVYVDGADVGSYTSTYSLSAVTRVSLGQEWDNTSPSDFYTGAVDDVRIYARPLSSPEVAGLAGLTKPMAKPF